MNKKEIILWMKRALAFFATLAWMVVIFNISQMSGPFMEQAPYCMGSTMLIFGVLTALYKGLDYWSLKDEA